MAEKIIHDLIEGAQSVLSAIGPAALGSAVAQAYQRGLGWRERFTQWCVGIVVSHYVTMALVEWLDLGPFAGQAIGFVLGMIAFQSAPRFIAGAGDVVGRLPEGLAGWLPFKRKDPEA